MREFSSAAWFNERMSRLEMTESDTREARWDARAGRTLTAACVAVVLYASGGIIGWLASGSHPDGLGRLAVGAVVVFAISTAIRGVNAIILRTRRTPVLAVVADLAMCVAAMIYVGIVGSLNDSSGITLYSVVILSGFLLPAVAVVSSIAEIVIRLPRVSTAAMVLAGVVGIAALTAFATTF